MQIFTDLEIKSAQLTEILKQANATHSALATELNARRAETQTVANLTSQAEENTEQTGKLLNQASGAEGKLQQILSNQETNLENSKTELHALAQQVAALGQSIKEATDHLTQSKGMLAFMQEKEAFVNEIAGKSGAGLLGGQFKDRKEELKRTSMWWLGGFVAAFLASSVWLFIAYKYLRVTSDDIWLVIVSNFGLLLPAVFVLGFVAKQYSKERHYQEEYAFRSAVAMTLSSFADRLKGTEQNGERLISDTVEMLYKLPIMLQEKTPSPGLFQSRSAPDTIKATTELMKEFKKTE
ncbi:MAG: hypothetical protein EBS84_16935 [Proteobacteria bacterium]|nr:hypothetical protein [Verrucomicrobiota bacterium]NBU10679.1 hypothetical protein [Pseudomonadota bacterium]